MNDCLVSISMSDALFHQGCAFAIWHIKFPMSHSLWVQWDNVPKICICCFFNNVFSTCPFFQQHCPHKILSTPMEHFVPSFQISWHNAADAVYKLKLQVSLSRLTKVLLILKPHRSINKIFERKTVNIFLPISFNIWFGCSKEPSQWDGSLSTHGICFDIDIIRKIFFLF